MRSRLLPLGAVLALAGLFASLGYVAARDGHKIYHGPVAVAVSSSPDQIPSTPTTEAPPYLTAIAALGCKQKTTATIPAANALLIRNAGTIQLRLSGGPISTPEWPLAPGAWIHVRFGGPALYRITGARYSCTNSGIPSPHFTLDVTVSP